MAPKLPIPDVGAYVREQRINAQLTVRQLADLAGISNPYLSQIERGLKRPSAEILQRLSQGLQISAETLYVRAGILEAQADRREVPTVLRAIDADRDLTVRQRAALTDIYTSFVAANAASVPASDEADDTPTEPEPPTAVARKSKPRTKRSPSATKEK